MKRVICTVPQGLRLPMLTPEQRAAIAQVYTQFVLPMAGTQPANGKEVVDGLVADTFDPQAIDDLELPFDVIGIYQWNGQAPELTTIQPISGATLLPHLPDVVQYDEQGEEIGTEPATPHVPMNWAGWPQIQL